MKPKLVLHICCAPDEAWVVHTLRQDYQLHCYFCNHNISPREEYALRYREAERVAERYTVPFTASTWSHDSWQEAVRGFEDTPEGGERCMHCFRLRLRETAQFTSNLGWPAFTTVMSISPHKHIEMLNHAGMEAAEEFGLVYEPFNFKKNDGFRNSIHLSEELGLYRQNYCGCELSKKEAEERKLKRDK